MTINDWMPMIVHSEYEPVKRCINCMNCILNSNNLIQEEHFIRKLNETLVVILINFI